MAFDQETRNRLQRFVGDARKLLSEEFIQQLQNTYGLDPVTGGISEFSELPALSPSEQQTAVLLRDTLEHYLAANHKANQHKDKKLVIAALDRIVREQAFTVLNRLAALRMAEARQFVMESISQGYQSKGFQLYQRIAGSSLGETGQAYQHYLFSVFDELSLDLAVLFDRYSSQGRLFPRETVLLELLDLINHAELEILWAEDETVGWIYQYFNSKEERKKMRDESQAPRNSRELAVRNQFFTPRYVVEFLTDNTLGRIWYEMTQGNTALVDSCQYLVRRPNEIFLKAGEQVLEQEEQEAAELSQAELLQQIVYVQYRPIKDPRDIKMLDPACGSMHFGLYAFDLFEQIYTEAWDIEADKGSEVFFSEEGVIPRTALHESYPTKEAFLADVPRLIIENNIHGVDIDPRAAQIAGLSLWLRAQKSWSDNSITPNQRPQVQRSNIVCAEPMPGETQLLKEFTSQIQPCVLGQLVEDIFDKMKLAGEAGTLLKIEEEIQSAIEEAKSQKDENVLEVQGGLFGGDKWEVREGKRYYNFGDVSENFWEQAEQLILSQLERYSEAASGEGSGKKRLFAADAAKGFAFIDLSRKLFDVVLMNPPFGDASKSIKKTLSSSYQGQPHDLYSCFIERAICDLCTGKSGYVTPREFINYSSFKNLRSKVIFPNSTFELFADFGLGVMDDAMVRAAVYILDKGTRPYLTPFLRLIGEEKKEQSLLDLVGSLKASKENKNIYFADQRDFVNVGEGSLAYWIPKKTIKRFSGDLFGDVGGDARLGVQTANNFQFLRLFSEVNFHGDVGDKWRVYLKGGEFQKYYNNIHMLIDWRENGEHIEKSYGASVRLRDISQYERPGLNYPLINENGINVGVLPARAVYDNGSPSIYPFRDNDPMAMLGLLNTSFSELCFRCLTSTRHWQVGYLRKIPWQPMRKDLIGDVKSNTEHALNIQRLLVSENELSVDYRGPFFIRQDFVGSVTEKLEEVGRFRLVKQVELIETDYKIDVLSKSIFQVNDDEVDVIRNIVGLHPCDLPRENESDVRHHRISLFPVEKMAWDKNVSLSTLLLDKRAIQELVNLKEESIQVISYLFGYVLGRWRLCDKSSDEIFSDNVFDEFVSTKLISEDERAEYYFIEKWNKGNFRSEFTDDLIGFEDNILDELCNIAGVKCEDYFINPNGFFKDHLKKYTASQRQAPIYWPLQSASNNFTMWVYFHNVDSQLLFSCVNEQIADILEGIQEDLQEASSNPNGDTEKLLSLQAEITDYREDMISVAEKWKPNRNDGVLLTAAPLWRLFNHTSWREKLKRTWGELDEGKYDWSSVAYNYWPERVLRKAYIERSIAVAQNVESDLWEEVEVVGARGREGKLVWQPKDMSEDDLDAYIRNKIAQG